MHAFVSFNTVASSPPALKVCGATPGLCLVIAAAAEDSAAVIADNGRNALLILCEEIICLTAFSSHGPQVSCNDFDLVWELDSCYWMEKVACMYSVRRVQYLA